MTKFFRNYPKPTDPYDVYDWVVTYVMRGTIVKGSFYSEDWYPSAESTMFFDIRRTFLESQIPNVNYWYYRDFNHHPIGITPDGPVYIRNRKVV